MTTREDHRRTRHCDIQGADIAQDKRQLARFDLLEVIEEQILENAGNPNAVASLVAKAHDLTVAARTDEEEDLSRHRLRGDLLEFENREQQSKRKAAARG